MVAVGGGRKREAGGFFPPFFAIGCGLVSSWVQLPPALHSGGYESCLVVPAPGLLPLPCQHFTILLIIHSPHCPLSASLALQSYTRCIKSLPWKHPPWHLFPPFPYQTQPLDFSSLTLHGSLYGSKLCAQALIYIHDNPDSQMGKLRHNEFQVTCPRSRV